MAWDADQYLKFEDFRTRPARDLLAAVPLQSPSVVVDLGCGTGTSTALLVEKFRTASVTGIDNSADMLTAARKMKLTSVNWQEVDASNWAYEDQGKYDLIFSNALLHWLGAHETLMPQLVDRLSPGGVLAVQMPRNFDQPSHMLVSDVLGDMGLTQLIPTGWIDGPVGTPPQYDHWLEGCTVRRQIWTTTYYHHLSGDAPVYNWIKGAALRPILSALDDDQATEFEQRLIRLLGHAYPPQSDGMVLFPFTRLFIVAIKG